MTNRSSVRRAATITGVMILLLLLVMALALLIGPLVQGGPHLG